MLQSLLHLAVRLLLMRTASMSIFACGFNEFHQIIKSSTSNIISPTLITQCCQQAEEPRSPQRAESISDVSGDRLSINRCSSLPRRVVISWDRIFYILNDGTVILCGNVDSDTEKEFNWSLFFKNKQFRSLSCMGQEFIGIDLNCKIYSSNKYSVYPREIDPGEWLRSKKDAPGESLHGEDIHPEDQQSTDVCLNGEGLLFFSSSNNQLSLARINLEPILEMLPLNFSYSVKDVSCGKHHALILTVIGVVFTVGTGSQGQLGHGSINMEAQPRVVEALEGVTMLAVAAGGWHSMALSDFGDVYVWGWNNCGQLGLPCRNLNLESTFPRTSQYNSPESIGPQKQPDPFDENIYVNVQMFPVVLDIMDTDGEEDAVMVSRIACGSRHSVAVLESGSACSWGWNSYGQLGHGDTDNRDKPTVVEFFKRSGIKIHNVFAGFWNTVFITQ